MAVSLVIFVCQTLEELVDEGLIRSIGLSNFNSLQIKDVIDNSRIKPAVLQVRLVVHIELGIIKNVREL
jgi:diketogulonate reductase-like aldo/keto reductase